MTRPTNIACDPAIASFAVGGGSLFERHLQLRAGLAKAASVSNPTRMARMRLMGTLLRNAELDAPTSRSQAPLGNEVKANHHWHRNPLRIIGALSFHGPVKRSGSSQV